MDEIYRI